MEVGVIVAVGEGNGVRVGARGVVVGVDEAVSVGMGVGVAPGNAAKTKPEKRSDAEHMPIIKPSAKYLTVALAFKCFTDDVDFIAGYLLGDADPTYRPILFQSS